jgi:hypothetical protein
VKESLPLVFDQANTEVNSPVDGILSPERFLAAGFFSFALHGHAAREKWEIVKL